MIELPRRKGTGMAILAAGLFMLLVGGVMADDASKPLAGSLFFLGVGVLIVVPSIIAISSTAPRLRADAAGVWFGGGRVIPWTDIKAVFASGMTVQRHQAQAISFEFHTRATLLRTPFEYWVRAPFSVGDLDVAPDVEGIDVLAARIEALRLAAGGTDAAR